MYKMYTYIDYIRYVIVIYIDKSHSNRCDVISQCDFGLHFPNLRFI